MALPDRLFEPWISDHDECLSKMQQRAAFAPSFLQYLNTLDINSEAAAHKLTGIACLMGKRLTSNIDELVRMLEQGMNIAVLNFSQYNHEEIEEMISYLKNAANVYGKQLGVVFPLAIALETKGTDILIGNLEDGRAELQLLTDSPIRITSNPEYENKCNSTYIYVNNKQVVTSVKPGDKLYLDSGNIRLGVKGRGPENLECVVEVGGFVQPKCTVQVPGMVFDMNDMVKREEEDIDFALGMSIDYIFCSCASSASRIKGLRKELGDSSKGILIFAKIENSLALENIDEIIAESDGVVISRGNLGTDLPVEKLFLAQKIVIAKCNQVGKPIICSSHILHSMVRNPIPSRAEVSDAATTVMDGADCIMLSSETSRGLYPSQCVQMLTTICKEAEAAVYEQQLFSNLVDQIEPPTDPIGCISICAVHASLKCSASAIIVITTSGKSASGIAKFRPRCPVLAITRYAHIARRLMVYKSIIPLLYITPSMPEWMKDVDARIQFGITFGKTHNFIKAGDPLILVSGWRQGSGFTNTLRIIYASPM